MVTKENRTKTVFARQIISALVVMFVHIHPVNSYSDLVLLTKGQTLLLEVENPPDCLINRLESVILMIMRDETRLQFITCYQDLNYPPLIIQCPA